MEVGTMLVFIGYSLGFFAHWAITLWVNYPLKCDDSEA